MLKHDVKILLRNLFLYIMWIILLLVVRRVYPQDIWRNWDFYEVPDYSPKQIVIDHEDRKWIVVVNGARVFDGEQWVKYTKNTSGLTDYTIHTMVVDGDGGIWFGTNNGATRFDGEKWITYDTYNSGITSNVVKSIALDRKGGIWFSSGAEISHFDGREWGIYPSGEGFREAITSIAVDHKNHAWFGTYKNGIKRFDGTSWRTYNTYNSGIVSKLVTTVAVAPDDRLMIGTMSGLSEFDGMHWKSWNNGRESGISSGDVLAIDFDSNGLTWIATEGGFSCYDGESWATFPHSEIPVDEDDSNSNIKVRDLAIDKDDNVWLVTNKGLYRYIPEFLQITGSFTDEIYHPGESVELTWLAARIQDVKIEYTINDEDTWHEIKSAIDADVKIITYTIPFDIIPRECFSMKMTIRISSSESPEISDEISFYVEDEDLRESFVTFTQYNSGLVSNRISAIFEDNNGIIWFVTDCGVSGYSDGEWKTITTENSGLVSNNIYKIFEDRNGVLWFITDKGVSGFDGTGWVTFTIENSGLANNKINHMVSAPDGSLWFATAGGLSRYDGETWMTWFEEETIQYLGVDRRGRVYKLFHRFDDDTQKAACHWHSHHEWGIVAYDGEKWVQEAKEYSLINVFGTDPDGCLWFAAFDYKMIKYDGISWCVYPCPPEVFWVKKNGIEGDFTWSSDGTIWINNTEKLYSFDGREWENYPFATSFFPGSMAAAPDGSLWCAEYFDGIAVFNGAHWKTYLCKHGCPLYGNKMVYVDSNNVKWFAGFNGVTRFDDGTMIQTNIADRPEGITLMRNYPNPFNSATTISFSLKSSGFTELVIYNVMGQKVRTLLTDNQSAGNYTITWDGRDSSGVPVSSGMYVTSLKAGNKTWAGKMLLVK